MKAVGAAHSFTAIAETKGMLLDPSAMTGLLGVDVHTGRARFRAGTRLHEIPALPRPYRRAMQNLGDIDRQTTAGALSTGTHGTGVRFGGLATQVTGLVIVLGDGSVLRALEGDRDAELLPALRVSLGAGVIAEVELQCVPAFVLEAREHPEPWDAVLEDLPTRMSAADHVEFYWWPHTDAVMTETHVRSPLGTSVAPVGAASAFLEDRVLGTATPALNRFATRMYGDRDYSDLSHRVLTTRRDVRFRESEWAVPLERLADALRALRALIDERGWRISFPVEVRTAAADANLLSTAYGRDTGYLAVHRWWRDEHEPYFRAVDELMREFDRRPHWGTLHFRGATDLVGRYPRFGELVALRDRLDPDRVFANPQLARVLGS